MLYPISFSIPKQKICENYNVKTKILSNLIPGNTSTYIYNNEEEYYNEYKTSYFAITIKKGGWDCMRHYEILANGCIPYFLNIENCPENTMYLLQKKIFIQCNTLYETKFKNKNINELNQEEIDEYKGKELLKKKLILFIEIYVQKYLPKENKIEIILYTKEETAIIGEPKGTAYRGEDGRSYKTDWVESNMSQKISKFVNEETVSEETILDQLRKINSCFK